ncbi:DUF4149 domain-containing protein [Neisseria canis]|uniref:TMEM205-like domain-containing protein n=1 Tax=Neisseria canis TaxID=493 RepID=A0A1X3CWB0_9NEIS|nr:DUF4149 domain-containing protein [Neisseria canis]OSI11711.1 hypothetical protein BWD07_09180 [Neisseria canis]VEF03317.1 Uncharacterised protein [Neisseria canis]
MNRFAALIAGSWLGMQIMAGYVAAPILFKSLDRVPAGDIAGKLFTVVGYYGLAAWFLVYAVARIQSRSKKPQRWIALQIVLLGINQLAVTPVIETVKQGQHHPLLAISNLFISPSNQADALTEFAFWHGLSSLIYMATSVLGLLLLSVFLRLGFGDKKTRSPEAI